MNNREKNTRQILQELTRTGDEYYAKYCEVTAVNEEEKTCALKPLDGSSEIREVLLLAGNSPGVFCLPLLGSVVAVSFVSKTRAVVVAFSELKRFDLLVGESKLSVSDNHIVLNKGENKGMVKVEALVKKLNALENALNALVGEYNTHTHPTPAGPSSVPTLVSTQQVSTTTVNDLENKNITH